MVRSTIFIHVSWVNQLFLWPCSIAVFVSQRANQLGKKKIWLVNPCPTGLNAIPLILNIRRSQLPEHRITDEQSLFLNNITYIRIY